MYYLFDNISLGIILSLGLEVVAIILYHTSQWRWRRPMLASGFVLLALFVGMDLFVETNREQLERLTRDLVHAVQEEQPRAVAFHLSPQLLVGGTFTKKQVTPVIAQWLEGDLINSNMITRLEVTRDAPSDGRVALSVITQFNRRGRLAAVGLLKSRWELIYRRDGDRPYKIVDIVNTSINDGPGIDWVTFKLR